MHAGNRHMQTAASRLARKPQSYPAGPGRRPSVRCDAGGRVEAGLGPAAADDERVVGAVELTFPRRELLVGLREIARRRLAIDVGGGQRLVDEDQDAVAA